MTWNDFLDDWTGQIDRIVALFPRADRCALVRFRGNRERLAQYLADAHDLTPAEGCAAIEERLLPGARASGRVRLAAE